MKTVILFIGVIMMNAVIADENYNQPLFSLEFNIFGTGAEIRLNDIPVYYHDAQGQTSSQKPVPESIVDGENILTVKSFPLEADGNKYQPGAYIETIISVREKDAPINQNKSILQIKINPTNPEDKILTGSISEYGDNAPLLISHAEKQTLAERRTNIKSPFPRWAWQDGLLIENTQDNYKSLLNKYKEVWDVLKSGNVENVRKLYDSAAQEFAFAYHYQDANQGHRLMNTGGLIKDDEWGLGGLEVRLQKRKYTMMIYGGGRLAKIVDTKGNESLITYLNKNVRMVNFQKFGFYKNINGEWIMIR